MDKEKILDKIESFFKEEIWGRVNPKDVNISRFKTLEELFNRIVNENMDNDVVALCKKHIENTGMSFTAYYLLGLIAYHRNLTDDKIYLKELIEIFRKNFKWALLEYLCEKVLEYGENRYALRALAESLEKLKRKKEAMPVWEEILKLNRFDAEIAKKLSFAIIEDDAEKSNYYMKIALEGYIKQGNFNEIEEIWHKLIESSWEDTAYFERIERMLVDSQKLDIAAAILMALYEKFKDLDINRTIDIMKRVLKYKPADVEARKKLIKLYEKKYESNSQLKRFIDLSKINIYSVPIASAIKAFEKNIVFDNGNYVIHRNWGLGRITSIDKDNVVINFEKKENHQMSVNMALQSLMPVPNDHLYVLQYEDPKRMKDLFSSDFIEFFKIYIKSYNNMINVSDMKKDLIPEYVEMKNWSKWWNRTRSIIKKNPIFGFSDKKRDVIFLREKPVTLADDLVSKFAQTDNFSGKLDIALEFVNNVEAEEGRESVNFFVEYFKEKIKDQSEEKSNTKLILSYFILKSFEKFHEKEVAELDDVKKMVIDYIKTAANLPSISKKISSYDYKKDFVNLIIDNRDDHIKILTEILFETPIRIHRYIFSILVRKKAFTEINQYIERTIAGYRDNYEIFLWVSRSILSKEWSFEWLDYSKPSLVLSLFRLLSDFKKIELTGNRLKNSALELITGNEYEVFRDIVKENDEVFLSRVYDLASGVDFIDEHVLDMMKQMIKEKIPGFQPRKISAGLDDSIVDEEEIITTKEGFDKRSAVLKNMINEEMVQIQKELANESNQTADVRENVDYNALMEKQSILKKAISKLDTELKKAKIIDLDKVVTDTVSIGTTAELLNEESGDTISISIVGPWDTDFEKNILSYRSDVAKKLLRKKVGNSVELHVTDFEKKYKIIKIEKFSR